LFVFCNVDRSVAVGHHSVQGRRSRSAVTEGVKDSQRRVIY
jgi:hypothetical protein